MATTISGTAGVTFPAGGVGNPAGAVVGTTDTQTLTNKTLSTGLVMGVSAITSGTAVASTSGTSISFTSIPSWVKRISVLFKGVSTSGTSNLIVQIGSGSITSTGYTSGFWTANTNNGQSTTAFQLTAAKNSSAVFHGVITIDTLGSNVWVESHSLGDSSAGAYSSIGGGAVTLSGTLDRLQITTGTGTDTFTAGSINILYE
jgi:hypothetical protein